MTDKQLTLKFKIYGALTSALRVGSLYNLDLRFMTRAENKHSFHFKKLSKSWRQEQKLSVAELLGYSDDKELCLLEPLMKIYCIIQNGGNKVIKPRFCLVI